MVVLTGKHSTLPSKSLDVARVAEQDVLKNSLPAGQARRILRLLNLLDALKHFFVKVLPELDQRAEL